MTTKAIIEAERGCDLITAACSVARLLESAASSRDADVMKVLIAEYTALKASAECALHELRKEEWYDAKATLAAALGVEND